MGKNIKAHRRRSHFDVLCKIRFSLFKKTIPILHENTHEFNDAIFNISPPYMIDGYWQSEKYFFNCTSHIRHFFQFDSTLLDDKNLKQLNEVQNCNSVSIHVRRGDYLDPSVLDVHGVCDLDYYKTAIKLIKKNVINPVFFLFSDDISWVIENLTPILEDFKVVDNNLGKDSWKDMFLQSECMHNIIANSSFSWWAAWLNDYKQRVVVAPRSWFLDPQYNSKDRVPKEWLLC